MDQLDTGPEVSERCVEAQTATGDKPKALI